MLLGVDVTDATEGTVVLRDRSQVDPAVAAALAQQQAQDGEGAIGGVAVAAAPAGSSGAEAGGSNIVLPADMIVWTAGACSLIFPPFFSSPPVHQNPPTQRKSVSNH